MAVLQGILHFNFPNNNYMLFHFNNTYLVEFKCINLKTSNWLAFPSHLIICFPEHSWLHCSIMKHHFYPLAQNCHVTRSWDIPKGQLMSVTRENQCSVRANICNKKYCVYISCCPEGGAGDRQITLENLGLHYLLFYRYNC